MRNIKLILEYDGTNYHGWQSQTGSGNQTIQENLEHALKTLTNEDIRTTASGRTDAGVHAYGQVANFLTRSSLPAAAFVPSLNHLLPKDVRILASEEAAEEFHARFSALGKVYQYRILNRRPESALERHFAWHVKLRLNIRNMKQAASFLAGRHDFSAFRGSGCTAKSPVRTLRNIQIRKSGDFIEIWMEADAFLRYMVRNITGTLVEVGAGRFKPADVAEMLASCDRTRAGRTAPPQGLYLMEVRYEEESL